jgi:hypothetical protein
MEISLKTGIEHRFSLSEVKSAAKLHVLLGKLRNSMEFSHGILFSNIVTMIMIFTTLYGCFSRYFS